MSLKAAFCWLSLLGLLTGCNRQPQEPQVAPQATPQANYFRTHFQDESQFIVETVLTDLAEMAGYAQSGQRFAEILVAATERSGSQFRLPSYEVKIVSGKQVIQKPLEVSGPIWAPELYEDFARTLLASSPAASSRQDRNDLSVFAALTDLQAQLLEARQNADERTFLRLSAQLDAFGAVTFTAPIEGYIRRMLWALAADGVIPDEACDDPWGPAVPAAERDAVRRFVREARGKP